MTSKERGILVKFDDGFIGRIDHETAVRKAEAVKSVPRTTVIRDLLKFALDHFARYRGEGVPSAEPVTLEELPDESEGRGTGEGGDVRVEGEANESGAVEGEERGAIEAPEEGLAGGEHEGIEEAALGPEPEAVVAGRAGGEGWIGSNVRMVGVVGRPTSKG